MRFRLGMKIKDSFWQIKYWQVPHLDNLDLMHASNITHDYPCHIHEDYCIVIMLRGEETNIRRGRTFKAFSGNLMLLNAEEAHTSKSFEAEYRILNIRPKMLERLASDAAGRNIETFYFSSPVVKSHSVFRSLLNLHYKLEQKASPLEQESQFISTITSLLAQQIKYPKPKRLGNESHRVKLLRDYIKSRYAENISLTELSSLVDLSSFHLLRVFRDQVGVPPHEYQIHMRINEARNLLRNGNSIAETALKVGFFDQSHFSRNFKRITGMTPGYYLSYSK